MVIITPEQVDRFWSTTAAAPNGCIIWTLSRSKGGYGVTSFNKRGYYAHRIAYELRRGPIPEGLELDHLCRVRACLNDAHLEPVTRAENLRRGLEALGRGPYAEACPHGHAYDESNTRYDRKGHRRCRECNRLRANANYRKAVANRK